MALCEKWFDIDVPFKEQLDDEFAESATEKIVGNGVFGFENDENKNNYTSSRVKHYGKARLIWESIFLPYNNFMELGTYEWLKDRKWLLPVAWIWRAFKSIFSESSLKRGARSITQIVKTDLNKTTDFYEQWGM